MSARKSSLRAVKPDEREIPPTLLEAVEAGDILAIMKAQRRIIAESLLTAPDNTRPQFSNELNKLNALIDAEETARAIGDGDDDILDDSDDEEWSVGT